MGHLYKWTCKKCGYTETVSGKYDYGFNCCTVTCVCESCKAIMDLQCWKSGQGLPQEKIVFYPLRYYLVKKYTYHYQEVSERPDDSNVEYFGSKGRFYVLVKTEVEKNSFANCLDLFKDKVMAVKENMIHWYNFFGFKKVEIPVKYIIENIKRCDRCGSEDVKIWLEHICPKCGADMEKDKIVLFWD